MEKKKYMSPEEAAPLLGISPSKIRQYMRNGALDLGLAIDPKKSGEKNWRFKIYPKKLYKVIGGDPNGENRIVRPVRDPAGVDPHGQSHEPAPR